MTTVSTIISDALLEIGVGDPGEAMTANDAAYGLRALNRMIALWNTQEMMVYTVNRNAYDLVASKQTYTFGTGGDFNAVRPVQIQMASVLVNGMEIPIAIQSDEEWQAIPLKSTPGRFPTKLWITNDVPLNNLWFWPIPGDSTVDVILYCWGRVSAWPDINQTVTFPDGYEEALVTNLALTLSSSYGRAPDQGLVQRARLSKSALQTLNNDPPYLWGSGGSLAIQSQGLVVDR